MDDLNFFVLFTEGEGSPLRLAYQDIEDLVRTRDTIVDKFHEKFSNEKSYETITRYYGLLLTEYCEFIETVVVKGFSLERTLEELADIILYQASLVNELRKNVCSTEEDWDYLNDRIQPNRAYDTEPLSGVGYSIDTVFTAYFYSIFRPLIDFYPDRKYHRGVTSEVTQEEELNRTVNLINLLEIATMNMVVNNLKVLNIEKVEEIELVELVDTLNHILRKKIDTVDNRLVEDYEEGVVIVDEEETVHPNEISAVATEVLEDTGSGQDYSYDGGSEVFEVLNLDNDANYLGYFEHYTVTFRYIGDISALTFNVFMEDLFLADARLDNYTDGTQTSGFTPVDGKDNVYTISWIQ